MNTSVYRYRFTEDVRTRDIESALDVALFSVRTLHGEAKARMEVGYVFDRATHTLIVDGATACGRSLAKLLTGHLTRQLGEEGFRLDRLERQASSVAEDMA